MLITWRAGWWMAPGNPIGEPVSIDVATAGLKASQRDGRVRAAISRLLDHRPPAHLLGDRGGEPRLRRRTRYRPRNPRPRKARETVAPHRRRHPHRQIPRAADRHGRASQDRCDWRGCGVHQPLGRPALAKAPLHDFRTRSRPGDHAAATAIGRRGLGSAIRRRPAGPRTRQRTSAGTPPARPDHHPSTTRDGAVVPAHRHAHNDDEACRSTGQHPPPAANTVRAAQDSLLLSNQEVPEALARPGRTPPHRRSFRARRCPRRRTRPRGRHRPRRSPP